METPPPKKPIIGSATSGVIIIDPKSFPEKKVAATSAKTQCILPPDNKKVTPTPTPSKSVVSRPVRILPKPETPQSGSAQIQSLADLSAVIEKGEIPHIDLSSEVTLPKHLNLMIKLLKPGEEKNMNQPNAHPNQKTVTHAITQLNQTTSKSFGILPKRPFTQSNQNVLKPFGGTYFSKPQPTQTAQQINKVSHSIKSVKTLIPAQLPHPNPQINQSAQQISKVPPSIKSTKAPIPTPLSQQTYLQRSQPSQQAIQKSILTKTNLLAKSQQKPTTQLNLRPDMQYIEFINEALYDNDEVAKTDTISLSDSGDDENVPGIEEKTLEYQFQIRKTRTIALQTQHIDAISKEVQTDEADDDRVYCGFINISKDGPDKYFNLRCFYCEAEYPISFYADFSDHIIQSHGDLEKVYVGISNDAKSVSIESEVNDFDNDFLNDSDSSDGVIPEELPPLNLYKNLIDRGNRETELTIVQKKDTNATVKEMIPEDFDDGDVTESASEPETSHYVVQNYDPNIDHNYSQCSLDNATKTNKMKLMTDEEPVDEITFGKTPREVILDFLDLLRGFRCLWRDRVLATASYDNELLDLMDIMNEKWRLNLKRGLLRKNLENIKAWYIAMSATREESGEKFYQHKYIEYYNKCAEFLPVLNTNRIRKITCDVCERFCYDLIGLQLHKYRKHKIGQLPYGCNKCDKRFGYVYQLRNHLKRHVKRPVAPKYFPPKTTTLPSKPEEYTCFECDKKLNEWDEFKKHLAIHPKGDHPYVCSDCGQRFKTSNLRTTHQRRHRDPAYPCELCEKRFYFAYHLEQHMDIHKGIRNFICEWCGKTFIRQKMFREHVSFAHMGRGFCKICNREYRKHSIFSKHLRTMHRPLIGTVEELSRRSRRKQGWNENRKGKGTGPRMSMRKYTYVTDPVTQKRRLQCPNCDKSYCQYDSLYAHCKKVHGSMIQAHRKLPSGSKKSPKSRKRRISELVDSDTSDTEEEEAAAVDSITESVTIKRNISVDQHMTGPNTSARTGVVQVNNAAINSTLQIQIKNENNITTTMSFEKFVDEIALGNNFALQSPSRYPPLRSAYEQSTENAQAGSDIKSEIYGVGDYEFMSTLNSSSGIHF